MRILIRYIIGILIGIMVSQAGRYKLHIEMVIALLVMTMLIAADVYITNSKNGKN